ncbi:hypothetical protein [Catellatospora citrea]|uniref:Trypsin-co-occurring domain-containing protein n=1 Tax=Catellatospora citrea TaxID=53366 RepID=A0A8J3KJU3_9ACTN|nr:hypothetical protein [Catellatospora citrea]RKE05473.1 hypothetical protein C8E86_0271 [Catellatospora citrea]GIG00149.1 hypothetical protein Cci01nite_52420 [Catellatospora citrea]
MTDIHVRVVPAEGWTGDLSSGPLVEKMLDRVNELGDSIVTMARRLGERIAADDPPVTGHSAAKPPWVLSQAQVTFSIDLEAEAGVIVSRAATSAGFEVCLTWSRAG